MKLRNLIPWGSEKKGALVRGEEGHPFQALQNEMNQVFENFFEGFNFGPFRTTRNLPVMDVVDKGTHLQISAELPGMTEKDIEITLADNVLTIKGEKKCEKEDKEGDVYRCERSYGAFQRSFQLPAEIDPEKVAATFKNGVLMLTLNKVPSATNVRKINVKKED